MNQSISNPDFDRFIEETGESDKIDAKGPMTWDNGPESASLAKDIAAFANTKDGGVIVIGKSENDDRSFQLDGLTEQQASTFETTKVATWVNNRFSPPISLTCHTYHYKRRIFIIITIDEFTDIPHLCVREFQDPSNNKKHILKDRTIYVRTANAESSPLGSVDELRALIGLATAKRGHEMLSMFSSILSGNPLLPNKTAEERFLEELSAIKEGLGESFSIPLHQGAWMLLIRPASFNPQLFEDDTQIIEQLIRRNQVRFRSDFPPLQRGTHMREWGLCHENNRETWGLTTSGQFILIRPYIENSREYKSPWKDMLGQPTEPELPSGKWMDIKPSLLTIAEFFAFAERFVREYGVGERMHFEIRATAINGRHLVTTDGSINRDMTPACRANQFTFTKDSTVEEFQATWKELAAKAMKRFSDTFPDTATSIQTMRYWVDRFHHKGF